MLLVVAGCSFGNHKLSSKKSEESKQETVKRIGRRERPRFREI